MSIISKRKKSLKKRDERKNDKKYLREKYGKRGR
jgi:hypothetical protein